MLFIIESYMEAKLWRLKLEIKLTGIIGNEKATPVHPEFGVWGGEDVRDPATAIRSDVKYFVFIASLKSINKN